MQPRNPALDLCDVTIHKALQQTTSYRLTPGRHYSLASIYTSLLYAATYWIIAKDMTITIILYD